MDEEVDEKGEEEKSKFWEKVRQAHIYLVLSSLRCLRNSGEDVHYIVGVGVWSLEERCCVDNRFGRHEHICGG